MRTTTIRWRGLEDDSREHLELIETGASIRARSVLIGGGGELDLALHYAVELDKDWIFRSLRIECTNGRSFGLFSDGQGHWSDQNGAALPNLTNAIDIDLSGSPFTNTLPIRRGAFEIGKPRSFVMAWVDMINLHVDADSQIYTKLASDRFRYQPVDRDFQADLIVDGDGLIVTYPGLFTRM